MLLEKCNVFILLTNYPNEGQPISIIEAMGNGMLIITTNHAGIPDLISSDNGLLINKKLIDLEYIYSYLIELLSNKEVIKRIGLENYRHVRKKYTEKDYVKGMEEVFEILLDRKDI